MDGSFVILELQSEVSGGRWARLMVSIVGRELNMGQTPEYRADNRCFATRRQFE